MMLTTFPVRSMKKWSAFLYSQNSDCGLEVFTSTYDYKPKWGIRKVLTKMSSQNETTNILLEL